MHYEPDIDYYIGLNSDFMNHHNPSIDEILPTLNDLFMETEVALNDLAGACSRSKLDNARNQISDIYHKVAELREDYQKVTGYLYQVV